ncbi:hypothetical protein OG393_02685 [Streptomyces sp. NBC_01216]|nr:hypothetical protein OG393_02685 [Streptomyces sp. NBC_01216]
MRLTTGHGTKGTGEYYDWAWLDIRTDDAPEGPEAGTSVLVTRRHRYTGEPSYFRCRAPAARSCRHSWRSSVAGGGSRRRSNSPRASPAWTRDR